MTNAPIKLCECNCGQPAPIATKTQADHGYVQGQPRRFIRGHQGRIPIGTRFGRLEVIAELEQRNHGHRVYRCRCDCKTEIEVVGGSLKNGNTQSCGCLQRERASAAVTTHGHSRNRILTPTYSSWVSLLSRCSDSNRRDWKHYGGRGITVCARWDPKQGGSFQNFLADMGERPKGKTLDRIETDGNYEPENCRWATQAEQVHNRRKKR